MLDETKNTGSAGAGNEPHDASEHEYDGIKELQNPPPFWIILLFIVTIAFSGLYAIKYFGYPNNGSDQTSEYNSAMAEAKLQQNAAQGAGAVGIVDEASAIAAGAKLYGEKGCIACHGIKGEGNSIGPNLTDTYWIHGCSDEDINRIITEGFAEKGMSSFKTMMTAEQIKQVSTYILKSLAGSNPPKAKEAQGVACK